MVSRKKIAYGVVTLLVVVGIILAVLGGLGYLKKIEKMSVGDQPNNNGTVNVTIADFDNTTGTITYTVPPGQTGGSMVWFDIAFACQDLPTHNGNQTNCPSNTSPNDKHTPYYTSYLAIDGKPGTYTHVDSAFIRPSSFPHTNTNMAMLAVANCGLTGIRCYSYSPAFEKYF
jgi:hypothetical protein